MGPIYGLILTPWGAGGPTLIARVREATGYYQGAMHIIATEMLLSFSNPAASSAAKPSPQTGCRSWSGWRA
jgi:hypothetical protein